MRTNVAKTAKPLVFPDDKLDKAWEFATKNILQSKYQGKQISVKNLKAGFETGSIQGERNCETCFHKSTVKLEDAFYEIYNGRQVDVERQVRTICLYCGALEIF